MERENNMNWTMTEKPKRWKLKNINHEEEPNNNNESNNLNYENRWFFPE